MNYLYHTWVIEVSATSEFFNVRQTLEHSLHKEEKKRADI